MKRELKFRAWTGEQMISPDRITRDGLAWWRENSIPTSSEKVMQFTGLKDKNGVEIYEGDILTFGKSYTKFKVLWKNDGFLAISKEGDKYGPFTRKIYLNNDYEELHYRPVIIGNIHQNPELV